MGKERKPDHHDKYISKVKAGRGQVDPQELADALHFLKGSNEHNKEVYTSKYSVHAENKNTANNTIAITMMTILQKHHSLTMPILILSLPMGHFKYTLKTF